MEEIRNFCIISHIDHGKSTLADRFLELTGTVDKRKMQPQFLDTMDLERERGITIKLQPCLMNYTLGNKAYILNLIDTPGHVDFSYEVSRSLAAVEGAILLVDATKGIQAQTLANLDLARKQNLVIIPAVNKIDSPQARIEETSQELSSLLGIDKKEIIEISAKEGINIEQVLEALIKRVPCPKGDLKKPLRALIFDSKYDSFKGVIAYLRLIDGEIKTGQQIYLIQAKEKGKTEGVGIFKPELKETGQLKAGEIGYIATGIKEPDKVRVGETITVLNSQIEPLPGYKELKPVVFASIYPEEPNDFNLLKENLAKLKLNDASLTFEPEMKEPLGRGYRCGFLGSLHAEIIFERLRREFGLDLVVSAPSVIFKITDKNGQEILINSPSDWPDPSQITKTQEPWVKLEVMTPVYYFGRVLEILKNFKGKYLETKHFSQERTLLVYEAPLREIILGFYDQLKGATQGYGSFNYEILDFRPVDLVKLNILIAGKIEENFSKIVPKDKAYQEGDKIIKKLKKVLPSQQFSLSLQAAVYGKIIARETIKARRKDVTAPLYGGDFSRKRKLLEKQKKGKKKLKEVGKIKIPQRVFLEMFK